MFQRLVLTLLLTVGLAGGGAYYNYVRNAHLDEDLADRKYAALDDAQLVQLREAYEAELRGLETRASRQSDGSSEMRGFRAADLKGRHEGFERFARKNQAWKQARGDVFGHQAVIGELEREMSIREAGLHTEQGRILRRVTTF